VGYGVRRDKAAAMPVAIRTMEPVHEPWLEQPAHSVESRVYDTAYHCGIAADLFDHTHS